jgi:glycine betaine/proline transport system substrate-binding protein
MTSIRRTARFLTVGLIAAGLLTACGSDDASDDTTAAPAESTGASAAPGVTTADGSTPAAATGEGIVLAVNPWTGSAVNANVAKVVLESQLGTSVELLDIDENATWVGMDAGEIDAVLEVWPSGHAADYETYVTGKKSVVDLGLLGPSAKIGWYVPTFVVDEHPELATWEGFKDPELAKLFATANTGDLGQFLMGDPSYVTFDEQIIANLGLPLQYIVGGSEAAVTTALDSAIETKTPVLVQFWQPHWLQSQLDLTEVELPEVTDECLASAAAADGGYACDYAPDPLYKAASAGLEAKNAAAFAFLGKFQLTTDQQNEIAAMIDGEAQMDPTEAASAWVAANPDIVATWLG